MAGLQSVSSNNVWPGVWGQSPYGVSINFQVGHPKLYGSGFVLPKGYPGSVTDDYLNYQARTLPAHITGWMSKSLATSSLIHALGVGSMGPSATVATSAAIKWITKDGIGAFGRFLVRSIQPPSLRIHTGELR
jgi:hypothetical protein